MKRVINSPTGLSPSEKKLSAQRVMDGLENDAISVKSGASISSSVRREMDEQFCYRKREKTLADGPWRDVITVDILQINGQEFKGTVRPREALDAIYKTALHQNVDNLHGVKIEFRGHPVISFRLKTEINIDLEFRTEHFSYTKEVGGVVDRVVGKVRGVREPESGAGAGVPAFNRKRIKIKNCNWGLSKEEILEWMETYGKVLVPISEEVLDLSEGEESFESEFHVKYHTKEEEKKAGIPYFNLYFESAHGRNELFEY